MTKRVVIDDKSRPELTLVISGQEFQIRRVVNAVRRLYGAMLINTGDAIENLSRLQKRADAGEDVSGELGEAAGEVDRYVQNREKTVCDCIEYILTGNGYEYDQNWWDENTDIWDRSAFVVECLNKDASVGGKKKVAVSTGSE
jgi:hypothetical protein